MMEKLYERYVLIGEYWEDQSIAKVVSNKPINRVDVFVKLGTDSFSFIDPPKTIDVEIEED